MEYSFVRMVPVFARDVESTGLRLTGLNRTGIQGCRAL